jgi:hypothetical protein
MIARALTRSDRKFPNHNSLLLPAISITALSVFFSGVVLREAEKRSDVVEDQGCQPVNQSTAGGRNFGKATKKERSAAPVWSHTYARRSEL